MNEIILYICGCMTGLYIMSVLSWVRRDHEKVTRRDFIKWAIEVLFINAMIILCCLIVGFIFKGVE